MGSASWSGTPFQRTSFWPFNLGRDHRLSKNLVSTITSSYATISPIRDFKLCLRVDHDHLRVSSAPTERRQVSQLPDGVLDRMGSHAVFRRKWRGPRGTRSSLRAVPERRSVTSSVLEWSEISSSGPMCKRGPRTGDDMEGKAITKPAKISFRDGVPV